MQLLLKDRRIDPYKAGPVLWQFACTFNHISLIHLLMEDSRFDFNISSDHFAKACANGHLNVVKFLLKHTKIQIDYADNLAIKSACDNNHFAIISVNNRFCRNLMNLGIS